MRRVLSRIVVLASVVLVPAVGAQVGAPPPGTLDPRVEAYGPVTAPPPGSRSAPAVTGPEAVEPGQQRKLSERLGSRVRRLFHKSSERDGDPDMPGAPREERYARPAAPPTMEVHGPGAAAPGTNPYGGGWSAPAPRSAEPTLPTTAGAKHLAGLPELTIHPSQRDGRTDALVSQILGARADRETLEKELAALQTPGPRSADRALRELKLSNRIVTAKSLEQSGLAELKRYLAR